MSIETQLRELAAGLCSVAITRRRRGPFVIRRPDGGTTEHKSRKEALEKLRAELRCTNKLVWKIQTQ